MEQGLWWQRKAMRRRVPGRLLTPLTGWLAFAAFALLLGFAFQGARGLWEPDEGRYAEVAREMLVSGDFLTPHLDLEPHFTKPPLTYWCIAASLAAFGREEWAVRLYLSLSFALTGLMVAALGARMWDRKTGFLAGTIYLTSLTPFIGASFVTPDTLLALWTAIALYGFWRATEHPSWRWSLATGAAFGLGFLTKGPPALAFLPGVLLWQRFARPRAARAGRRALAGVLLGVVIGLSWFLVVAERQSGLARYFLAGEVVGRIMGHHHRNSAWYGPLVIYGPALVGGALPWCLAWPTLWRAFRSRLGQERLRPLLRAQPQLALLLACFLPALILFCVVRSRLPLYVLPLFIPLALATARGLGRIELAPLGVFPLAWPDRRQAARLALWVLGLSAIRLGLAALPTPKDARSLYRALRPLGDVELIVEDRQSHHGLAFYSERDVEYVSGLGATPESVRTIPIAKELAEETRGVAERHLYLVRQPSAPRLDALLKNARATIRARQDIGDYEAIWTEPRAMTGGGSGEWRWAGPRAMPPG